MNPVRPEAMPQRASLEDQIISVTRPFGLLFPDARLTVPNETVLMRIVSSFRDLKLNESDATQRALIVKYLCFFAEKAVLEEGISFQPGAILNLSNDVGPIGQREGTQQAFRHHEMAEDGFTHDSRKRKRAVEESDIDRYEVEGDEQRKKEAINDAEIDDLVRYLEPIQFAIGGGFTIEHITAARRAFLAGVIDLNILTNHHTVKAFSVTEAVEITCYFFTTILGNDLQQRIVALVEFWNSGAIEDFSRVADPRAMGLACDESIPLPLRKFYRRFAQANRQYLAVETRYSTMMRHVENLALHVEWLNLNSKNSEFRNVLFQFIKFRAGKMPFKSAIKEHICSNLNIASTEELEDRMEAARGIFTLVKYFGCGILVVLPAHADKIFKGWADNKISSVFKLFKRTIGDLRPLWKILEARIYDPITAGHELPMLPRNMQGYSLGQMLQDLDTMAVNRAVTDERMTLQGESIEEGGGREMRLPIRVRISRDR